MMQTRNVKPLFVTALSLMLCAVSGAQAAMYKWTDAEGGVTYSNQAPIEPDKVRELTKIEGIDTSSAERAPETQRADKEKTSADSTMAKPDPMRIQPEQPARQPERSVQTREPSTKIGDNVAPRPQTSAIPPPAPAKFGSSFRTDPAVSANVSDHPKADTPKPDTENALRPRVSAGRTEAVRDPCLRSSDPKCYERNKGRYHPFLGYAPSVMEQASATGATAPSPGGGAVAGQVGALPKPTLRRGESAPQP